MSLHAITKPSELGASLSTPTKHSKKLVIQDCEKDTLLKIKTLVPQKLCLSHSTLNAEAVDLLVANLNIKELIFDQCTMTEEAAKVFALLANKEKVTFIQTKLTEASELPAYEEIDFDNIDLWTSARLFALAANEDALDSEELLFNNMEFLNVDGEIGICIPKAMELRREESLLDRSIATPSEEIQKNALCKKLKEKSQEIIKSLKIINDFEIVQIMMKKNEIEKVNKIKPDIFKLIKLLDSDFEKFETCKYKDALLSTIESHIKELKALTQVYQARSKTLKKSLNQNSKSEPTTKFSVLQNS